MFSAVKNTKKRGIVFQQPKIKITYKDGRLDVYTQYYSLGKLYVSLKAKDANLVKNIAKIECYNLATAQIAHGRRGYDEKSDYWVDPTETIALYATNCVSAYRFSLNPFVAKKCRNTGADECLKNVYVEDCFSFSVNYPKNIPSNDWAELKIKKVSSMSSSIYFYLQDRLDIKYLHVFHEEGVEAFNKIKRQGVFEMIIFEFVPYSFDYTLSTKEITAKYSNSYSYMTYRNESSIDEFAYNGSFLKNHRAYNNPLYSDSYFPYYYPHREIKISGAPYDIWIERLSFSSLDTVLLYPSPHSTINGYALFNSIKSEELAIPKLKITPRDLQKAPQSFYASHIKKIICLRKTAQAIKDFLRGKDHTDYPDPDKITWEYSD